MNAQKGFSLIPFLLIFVLASVIGILAYRIYQDKSVPVYRPATPSTFVDIKEIVNEIKDGPIEIAQPGPRAILPGATKWVAQTFNNCGPATTSMLLQYFGYQVDQTETQKHLRTNPDDKNVFTYEIRDYIKKNYNVESKLLFNGNIVLIKTLIANGFYVMVEDFLHANDDIGHTTLIRGYDDEQGVFIADDSFIGVNITYKYEEFDKRQWQPFNREYLPLYRAEQEPLLKAIISEDWDETKMYQNSVKFNQSVIDKEPQNAYAWFNLGTSYYGLKDFAKAKEAFDKSRSLGWPKRMLWYQIQPVQTLNELKEYQKAIDLASVGLVGNDSFPELHLEKALAYKGLGDKEKARAELNKAIYYYPNYQKAKDLLSTL